MDQKTLERAQRLLAFKWRAIEQDQSLIYELGIIRTKVKNEAPCCLDVLKAFYEELKILVEPQIQEPKMKSENFELNDKEMVLLHSENEYINNYNLTDDYAVKLLREDPKKISRFKKFPENWEEFIAGFKTGEPAEDFNQADAEAEAKAKTAKAKVPSKAKTAKAK